MPEPSILDERLAEIDRRLRVIQSGLVSVEEAEPAPETDDGPVGDDAPFGGDAPVGFRVPAEVDPPPRGPDPESALAPEPEPPARPPIRTPGALRAVTLAPPAPADERLAELVEAHERMLELHRELLSQYAEVLERRAADTTLAVTAGPFSTAAAVREFERALGALPGVDGVVVREYPGEDRVQLDVRLTPR